MFGSKRGRRAGEVSRLRGQDKKGDGSPVKTQIHPKTKTKDQNETPMPFTRNLYELDEVVAALQLCLCPRTARPELQALFWLWELVVSDEIALAIRTLDDAWARWSGGRYPGSLTLSPLTSIALRALTVYAAIQAEEKEKDGTAEQCLVSGSVKSSVESRTPTPLPPLELDAQESLDAQRIRQVAQSLANECWGSRDRRRCAHLIQAIQPVLSAEGIWRIIAHIAEHSPGPFVPVLCAAVRTLKQTAYSRPQEPQLLFQMNAVLLLSVNPSDRQMRLITPSPAARLNHAIPRYMREWDKWDLCVGRRCARIFSIPTAALHSGTTRGSLQSQFTNIQDIREPLFSIGSGCRYWRAMEFPDAKDDDACERFYDEHFPNDIPDEWSAADQEKSHGVGQQGIPSVCLEIPLLEEPLDDEAWLLLLL